MRLIDADELIATIEIDALNGATIKDAIEVIKDSPTVDAVEIVRCGDCRFYDDQYCHVNKCYVHSKKYFCVFGETEEMMKKKRERDKNADILYRPHCRGDDRHYDHVPDLCEPGGKKMKAILVIDMPGTCCDCPLAMWQYETLATSSKHKKRIFACVLTHKTITSTKRSRFCPLKEMPSRMIPEMVIGNKYAEGIVKGWNDCIEEMERSK